MDEALDCGHLYGFGDPTAKRTKLQEIVEQRTVDVSQAKVVKPTEELERQAKDLIAKLGQPLSLVDCLTSAESSEWGLALAAEFKRASPSKGDINVNLDAAAQALEYARFGAKVLSVLTEPKWFKGTLEDLRSVREKTQTYAQEAGVPRPACLRKDFIVDEYQILEALAHGADTVLLMVSILSQSRLHKLIEFSRSHGLEPLVEVVTLRELKVALDAGAKVLGVNNRDLHTFELDKGRTAQVARELKDTFTIAYGPGATTKLLALSGLSTAEDVEECRQISCSGVLVGEALMRAADPGVAITEMMGSTIDAVLPVTPGAVVAKVCGVKKTEDAACAVAAGANLIGIIFTSKSTRFASIEEATAVVGVVRKFGERSARVEASAVETKGSFEERCGLFRKACKRTPLVCGVFLDQSLDEVVDLATRSDIDAVQLHGSEDIDFIKALRSRLPGRWVVKVIHIPSVSGEEAPGASAASEQLKARLDCYAPSCDALLLDTSVKGNVSGGTGATFDWGIARRVQDDWGIPVIVAGGLTAANVGDLVTSVGPFGVDVASGVEDAPGIKNAEKTTSFIRNAKRARTGADLASKC